MLNSFKVYENVPGLCVKGSAPNVNVEVEVEVEMNLLGRYGNWVDCCLVVNCR